MEVSQSFNDSPPERTVYKGERKRGTPQCKSLTHTLGQVTEVTINSDKSCEKCVPLQPGWEQGLGENGYMSMYG